MNPHQYYHYPMTVAPGIQVVPGQLPPQYLTAQVTPGGIHVGLPPPPPPNALTLAAPKSINAPPQKLVDSIQTPVSSDVTETNTIIQETLDTESHEKCSFDASENNTVSTSDATSETTVIPAPPASSCSNPIVGGIYPAAYVQNALSQVSSTISNASTLAATESAVTGAHTQYMVAPNLQSGLNLGTHSSKVVYLPSAMTPGLPGNLCYVPSHGASSSPTVVMDQAGRQFVVNNPYHLPVQYQVAAPPAIKYPLPQQYVVASPQYVNSLQGQSGAALQPVYTPVQGLASNPAAPALTGLPQTPAAQQFYYHY